MKDLGLIPLNNFGEIVPNIYRSAQPAFAYQYAWLKNVLGLNTIVNLRSEKNMDKKFCDKLGIECIDFGVKDHNPPTCQMAKEFMRFINEHNNDRSILIHCLHGHGRTSTFSVLTKMANGMTLDEALQDEKNRFHFDFHHHSQEDFLHKLINNI